MKRSDRTIVIVLPVIALVVAFWMLVLSPKREEASKLDDEVAALEAEVAQAEQTADIAEQARANFDEDYQKVVTLGKAVPEDDDTASLITQISGVAEDAHVDFRSLLLADGGEEQAPPPEAPAPAEAAPTHRIRRHGGARPRGDRGGRRIASDRGDRRPGGPPGDAL